MDIKRYDGESEEQLILRVCKMKEDIGTWNDIKNILNELLGYDYDESRYRKQYQSFEKIMSANEKELTNFEDYKKEVEQLKFELLTERKKLQRINREYHENARLKADNDLYIEMCKEAIDRQKPIRIVPTTIKKRKISNCGLLIISDSHYGKEILLKGLDGEVINQYSPEIYKSRMWKLMSDFENDFLDNPVDKIVVDDLGDCIEGILRLGESIQKLRTGVTDSIEEYAQFMATWLCELWNRLQVPIEYNLIGGNHDIIRILQQKVAFGDENVAKNILSNIDLRIENAKLKAQLNGGRIDIEVKPYSDIVYNTFFGYNVFAYHGESKNMKDDIEFFENYYNIDIDLLIGGHLHSSESKSIGFGYFGDREIMRVPSIVGVDSYAKRIKKCSRAGIKYIIFDEDGRNWEKVYYLN